MTNPTDYAGQPLKPNKRAIRKWVKALRSGEYKQGKYVLAIKNKTNDNFRYCCLGVACEIAPKSLGLKKIIDTGNKLSLSGEMRVRTVIAWNDETTVLPQKVVRWLGIPDCNPDVFTNETERDSPYKYGHTLSHFNDNGHSFKKIADYIELTYLKD